MLSATSQSNATHNEWEASRNNNHNHSKTLSMREASHTTKGGAGRSTSHHHPYSSISSNSKNNEGTSAPPVVMTPSSVALLPDLAAVNDLLSQRLVFQSQKGSDRFESSSEIIETDAFLTGLCEMLLNITVGWNTYHHVACSVAAAGGVGGASQHNTTNSDKPVTLTQNAEHKLRSSTYTMPQALTVLSQWWGELCYLLQSVSEVIHSVLTATRSHEMMMANNSGSVNNKDDTNNATHSTTEQQQQPEIAGQLCTYDCEQRKVPIPVCVQHAFAPHKPTGGSDGAMQRGGSFLPDISHHNRPSSGGSGSSSSSSSDGATAKKQKQEHAANTPLSKVCVALCRLIEDVLQLDALLPSVQSGGKDNRFSPSSVVHNVLKQDPYHVFRTYREVAAAGAHDSNPTPDSPFTLVMRAHEHIELQVSNALVQMLQKQPAQHGPQEEQFSSPSSSSSSSSSSTLLPPWYQLLRLASAKGLRRVVSTRIAVGKAVSSTTPTALASVAAKVGIISGNRSSRHSTARKSSGSNDTESTDNQHNLGGHGNVTVNYFYEHIGPANQKMMTEVLQVLACDVNCIRALQLSDHAATQTSASKEEESTDDEAPARGPAPARRRSTIDGYPRDEQGTESSSDDDIDHAKLRQQQQLKKQNKNKRGSKKTKMRVVSSSSSSPSSGAIAPSPATPCINEQKHEKRISTSATRLLVEMQYLLDLVQHCLIMEGSSSADHSASGNYEASTSLSSSSAAESAISAVLATLLSPLMTAPYIFTQQSGDSFALSPVPINGIDVLFYALEALTYFDLADTKADLTPTAAMSSVSANSSRTSNNNTTDDQQTPKDFQQLQHRSVTIVTEILWHLLNVVGAAAASTASSSSSSSSSHPLDTAAVVGFRARFNLNVSLYRVLTVCVLPFSFKQEIRELRNDIMVVLSLMATHRLECQSAADLAGGAASAADHAIVFEHPLIDLLLQLSSQLEMNCIHGRPLAPDTLVDPRHHSNHKNLEDFSLKVITWDLLATLCRASDNNDDSSSENNLHWVGEWVPSLLLYLDIHCTFDCVTAWSTPLLLELQQHVLVILRYIAPLHSHHLAYPMFIQENSEIPEGHESLANGGWNLFNALQVVLQYVHHCPSAKLRSLSISFIATCAMCMKNKTHAQQLSDRDQLHNVGTIPLALLLLNTSVLVLRERNAGTSFSRSRGNPQQGGATDTTATSVFSTSDSSGQEALLTSLAMSLYEDTMAARGAVAEADTGSQLMFHWDESSDEDILALMIDCLQLLSDLTQQQYHRQLEISRGNPAHSHMNTYHINGVELLLPVLQQAVAGIRSPVATELKEAVVFGVIDLIYSAVVGCPENEAEFVRVGGVGLILSLLQRRQGDGKVAGGGSLPGGGGVYSTENWLPDWMIPLPLSCLADLLTPTSKDAYQIQERAGRQLMEWESASAPGYARGTGRPSSSSTDNDGRTGLQVLLSLWSSHANADHIEKEHNNTDDETDGDRRWPLSLWDEVGLAAVGPTTHRDAVTLPVAPAITSALFTSEARSSSPSSAAQQKSHSSSSNRLSLENLRAKEEVGLMLHETDRRGKCMLSPAATAATGSSSSKSRDGRDESDIVLNCDIAHLVLPVSSSSSRSSSTSRNSSGHRSHTNNGGGLGNSTGIGIKFGGGDAAAVNHSLNFKVYAVLSRLGFMAAPPADGADAGRGADQQIVPKPHASLTEPVAAALSALRHSVSSNLTARERTALTMCENYYLLCQDEAWQMVAASLVHSGIRVDFANDNDDDDDNNDDQHPQQEHQYRVCNNDGKLLQKRHLQAAIRAKKLSAARNSLEALEMEQEKKSELQYYKSLIKSSTSSPGI